ncbi:hypothetical protein EV360DRAFT_77720 [Lentinula raphanica]|nr:hypothetical protein EV360DRAFT_77720 [Lentinula raphanica]
MAAWPVFDARTLSGTRMSQTPCTRPCEFPSCSAAPMLAQPTLELTSIPKIDKNHFISSFVDTQKQHAKYYAEEGRNLWDNSSNTHNSKLKDPLPEDRLVGFSTPVLIPRNPKARDEPMTAKRSPKRLKKTNDAPKAKPESNPDDSKKRERPKKRREKPTDEDDEIKQRLAERRDRKRAKREIVRAEVIEDIADKDNEQPEDTRGKSGKRKRTSQDAPGLALMHGFKTTNVGKNRLTVPTPALGVFNRGKASAVTQVSKKQSKVVKPSTFQESVFLKGTSRRAKPALQEHSSNSSSSGSSSAPSTPPKPQTQKTGKYPDQAKLKSPAISTVSSSDPGTEAPIARAASEVWDIEREGFILPSKGSSSPPKHNESVVLKVQDSQWGPKIKNIEEKREVVTTTEAHEQDITSQISSSLAPSQSASQQGLAGRTENRIPHLTSKYFPMLGPHPVPVTPTQDLPFVASPSPLLQVRPPDPPVQNPIFEVWVAPRMLQSPHAHSDSPFCLSSEIDVVHMVDESHDTPNPWNPLTFSDPVVNGTDAEQQVQPGPYTSGISYPYDFYIPPRVDAPPPMQSNFECENEYNDFQFFNHDGSNPMNWAPQEMPDDNYTLEVIQDELYDMREQHSYHEETDEEHEDASKWDYQQQNFDDDMAMASDPGFGMDVEEVAPCILFSDPLEARVSSEVDCEDPLVEEMPRFLQGRELLLGLTASRRAAATPDWSGYGSTAEADVAKSLSSKGHWLPQKL